MVRRERSPKLTTLELFQATRAFAPQLPSQDLGKNLDADTGASRRWRRQRRANLVSFGGAEPGQFLVIRTPAFRTGFKGVPSKGGFIESSWLDHVSLDVLSFQTLAFDLIMLEPTSHFLGSPYVGLNSGILSCSQGA